MEQSDYVPNKIAESIVLALDGSTSVNAMHRLITVVIEVLDEYRDVIKKRAAWRERINALEAELKQTLMEG